MLRLILAGLLPALVAVPGVAQDSPIVTEAEFLAALDESHPAVAEGTEALALARARVLEANTFENPVLGAEREDPMGATGQIDWTVSWHLPRWNRRVRVETREAFVDAAAARLRHRLRVARLEMREVYAEWALAAARHRRLSDQAVRIEALARRAAVSAQGGESSGLDSHRLELAAAMLRSRVALAAAATEGGRTKATTWFPALPPDAHPALPALPSPPELGDDPPLVRAAESDLAAAVLERALSGRFLASPELTVGWQRQDAGSGSVEGAIFGFAWSVPVFDRNRAEKAVSEARVTGARARLERVRREVASARAGALATFANLAEALARAETALVENQRMLDGAEAAFRHGEATLTDLLETHRSVTAAELAVLDVHEAALAAHRDLERLATPDPTHPPHEEPFE